MQINEALRDLFNGAPKPLVIAIDGPAGSGKTTLASEISRAFAGTYSVEIIHLDEIYDGWDSPLSEQLFLKLLGLIDSQKSGRPTEIDIYDWKENTYSGTRAIKAAELLIIEGVGSCNKNIREKLTTSIWLEIDASIGMKRVLDRDGLEIQSEMVKWQEMEINYFADDLTRESVDFILSTQ